MSHRVHGMGTDLAEPDWPPLTVEEADRLLRRYPGAAGARALLWHSPRPLSAAALVATAGDPAAFRSPTVFVKRHHRAVRTAAGLREEHAFIRHLAAHGAPVVEVLADETGRTAVEDGIWTYEVHGLGAGVDLYRDAVSWSPFTSTGHARAAGGALARFHRSAAGYDAPARATRVLVSPFTAYGGPDPVAALEESVGGRPALADYLAGRAWRDDVARVHLPFHARLAPYLETLAPLWTHNDWHSSNLLWTGDGPAAGVRTVLDLGLADRTTAVFDLATAIERNVIAWLELDLAADARGAGSVTRLEDLDALLDGYTAVRPLSPAEAGALPALLPIVHAEFALSEVEYFHGVVGSRANADLAYDGFFVGHAAWFTSADGRDLLDHLHKRVA